MRLYYKIKAKVPTEIRGGVRKVEVEIMPDYMAYSDITFNKDDETYIQNEQGYQKGYDERTAIELLHEIYKKAISFDYIMLFEQTKSGIIKQIPYSIY